MNEYNKCDKKGFNPIPFLISAILAYMLLTGVRCRIDITSHDSNSVHEAQK